MIHVSDTKKALAKDYTRMPIGKVEIFDTPFTVPSHGFRIEFYEGGQISTPTLGTLKYSGNSPMILEDWGEGTPLTIDSLSYQVVWYGFFYAEFSGVYTFTMRCPVEAKFLGFFNIAQGTHPGDWTMGSASLKATKQMGIGEEASFVTESLTAGTWYPLKFIYFCNGAPSNAVVLFREPENVQNADGEWSDYDSTGDNHNGVSVEEHKVLGAGQVSYHEEWANATDASFIIPIRIPVQEIKGTEELSSVSEFSFVVPVSVDNSIDEYLYDTNEEIVQMKTSNQLGEIKVWDNSPGSYKQSDPTHQSPINRTSYNVGEWSFTDEKQSCDWCYSAKCIPNANSVSRHLVQKVILESGVNYTFSADVWIESGVVAGAATDSRPNIAIVGVTDDEDWFQVYSFYDLDNCERWQRLSVTAAPNHTMECKLMYWIKSCSVQSGKSFYFTKPKLEISGFTTDTFTTPQQRIKKNRLVKVYSGYQNGCNYAVSGVCQHIQATGWYLSSLCSGIGNQDCPFNTTKKEDYAKIFTGITAKLNHTRTEAKNSIEVVCDSIDKLLVEGINENYPNTVSYYAAGYLTAETDNKDGPNGRSKPRAYDGWMLDKAIRDLCLHAKIDSSLLYDREEFQTTLGNTHYGDYFVGQKTTRLLKNAFYGVTTYTYPTDYIVGDPFPTDAELEYNWKFDFGEQLIDGINTFSESYGCAYGANNEGAIYFKSINTPTFFTHSSTGDSLGWTNINGFTKATDIQAIKGGYFHSTTANDSITCTVFGNKFQVIAIRGEDAGSINKFTSIYNHCIEDVVDGGYTACEQGKSLALFGYTCIGTQEPRQREGAYFVFKADKSFAIDKLTVNINNPASYTDSIAWTYSIDIATLSSYPTSYEEITTAVYGTGLASSLSVFDFNKKGIISIDISETDLVADTIYAVRFMPDNIILPTGGFFGHDSVFVDAVAGGNYVTAVTEHIVSDTYLPKNYWPDIEFHNTSGGDYDSISVLVSKTESPYTLVYSGDFNLYRSGEDRYYYDGIDPNLGYNPTIIEINAQDMVTENSYHAHEASDIYAITVLNKSGDDIKIEGLLAYSIDINARRWGFSTAEDVENLKVENKSEEIRNDVFIVGGLKGPIRNLGGKVVNPNNPETEYFYSRSVDLNSIYQLDSPNSIGRKRPFILQLPNVKSNAHAHWLSINSLLKYRLEPKSVEIKTQGINFLEPSDCVGVMDVAENTISLGKSLWVEKIDHTISADPIYKTNISLTSIEPWESYYDKEEPDMNDFLDGEGNPQAFVGVSITTSMSGQSSFSDANAYNCYESELQNYIKIEYYQVNNGNVRIWIFPSGEDKGTHRVVSIVVPPIEEGIDLPNFVHQDWGKHTILWDGVSWGIDGRPKAKNTGYYIENGNWAVAFEYEKNGATKLVRSDRLPTNDNLNDQAELYVTSVISEYPTAGTVTITPTGCGQGHADVLEYDTDGIKMYPNYPIGAYWSNKPHVSCADFDNDNVTFGFSASGYLSGTFYDRWVTGKIKMYCTESIGPDTFITNDGDSEEVFNMRYQIGDRKTALTLYQWAFGRVYAHGGHWYGLGETELIAESESFDINGFYSTNCPATRVINPSNLLGINSLNKLELNKIERIINPSGAYIGMDNWVPYENRNETTEENAVEPWPLDTGVHGFMHNKAITLDFSGLKDRAGRPIFERFLYGSGDSTAGGQGTTCTGYRLCRHDRRFGDSYNENAQGDTDRSNCAAYIWWTTPSENQPHRSWYEFGKMCDECNRMCVYSKQFTFVPIGEGTEETGYDEDIDSDEQDDICTKYIMHTSDGTKYTKSMIDTYSNRHALNQVIFWHSSDYEYYPFMWLAFGMRSTFYETPADDSAYFCNSWSRQRKLVQPGLGGYYFARVLVSGELVDNDSGQRIQPF